MMNQLVPNIPLEGVNDLYKQLVSDTNMAVCLFCPDKPDMKYPTEAAIKQVLAKVSAEKLEPYVDKVSDEPLMKETPAGGKVVNTEKGQYESTVLTLSNGVRVVLKPTNFKADEIRMQAFSAGGNSLFDDKDALQFKVLNDVVSLGGLGNFSATDLQKVLAGKVASVSASVRTLSEAVNGSCAPKDLETLLRQSGFGICFGTYPERSRKRKLCTERLGDFAPAHLPYFHCTTCRPSRVRIIQDPYESSSRQSGSQSEYGIERYGDSDVIWK